MIRNKAPGALDSLLRLLTEPENRDDRWAFARFTVSASNAFADDLAATLRYLGATREDFEGEVTAILALRLFWRLIPRRLFTSADPDYELIAESVLEAELGGKQIPERVDALALVYWRMRDNHHHGRPKTTLDLTLFSHRELLTGQGMRCSLCRYRFPQHFFTVTSIEAFEDAEEKYTPKPLELHLDRYFRRPVLDHILPVFVGGGRHRKLADPVCELQPRQGRGDGLVVSTRLASPESIGRCSASHAIDEICWFGRGDWATAN
jgi:hypothetical protein